MKGPSPKPTSVQIAAGDPRKLGKRKLQEKLENEPQATHGLPDCPRHLKGRARAAWAFWAAQLADMNLDRRPDGPMLEGACVFYETYVKMHETIAEEGEIYERKEINRKTGEMVVVGLPRPHPAVAIRDRSLVQMKAFCSEFGLSPVSRTRLSVERKDEGEDLAAILSRPRPPRDQVQ